MDKRHLIWLIPLCLSIGFLISYLSFDSSHSQQSVLQEYLDKRLHALTKEIKSNDSLQTLLIDSVMTTRIAESVIAISENRIKTNKTKETNAIFTATNTEIDTMYESAYYMAMQRYRSGALYIQR